MPGGSQGSVGVRGGWSGGKQGPHGGIGILGNTRRTTAGFLGVGLGYGLVPASRTSKMSSSMILPPRVTSALRARVYPLGSFVGTTVRLPVLSEFTPRTVFTVRASQSSGCTKGGGFPVWFPFF